MDREQARQDARNKLPEYLDIITTKKGNQYICPFCGSGTGKNKTPAGQLNKDNQTFHCYSCNFHGDIFDIVAQIENISDEAEKFMRVYEIFNFQVGQNYKPSQNRADARPPEEKRPATDYTFYYEECHARAGETDYFAFRNINKPTIDKFMLGFDPAWRSPKALSEGKNPPASPRIIIPTSKYSYVARATDPNADPKYKTVKEGTAELFNREALWGVEPVFIVEGEIDALSISTVPDNFARFGFTIARRILCSHVHAVWSLFSPNTCFKPSALAPFFCVVTHHIAINQSVSGLRVS